MVQCTCGEILPKNKYAMQRHEAKEHNYITPQYKSHESKHLTDEEFDEIVKRGEKKFSSALIVPSEVITTRVYIRP